MPAKRLKEYLDQQGIEYVSIQHSPAYTAQRVAAAAHVPGREMAKTVMVNIHGRLAMAVLPSMRKVALQELRDLTGHEDISLASEDEFKSAFPDCEPGAMPPFGNLYGMDVYVAPELTGDPEIAFNAGTHREVIRMKYCDFDRLVQPQVAAFRT